MLPPAPVVWADSDSDSDEDAIVIIVVAAVVAVKLLTDMELPLLSPIPLLPPEESPAPLPDIGVPFVSTPLELALAAAEDDWALARERR